MKALERDRERRYESAHLFAADLQHHLACEPVTARPPGGWYRLRRFVKRHRVASSTAAAAVLILVVAASFGLAQAARARSEAARSAAAVDTLRASAPSFESQAHALYADGDVQGALEHLDYAAALRPDLPRYELAKADLLMADFQFAAAADVYGKVLEREHGLGRARETRRFAAS